MDVPPNESASCSSSKTITRSKTKCPILGYPEEMPLNQLPTKRDVQLHYLFEYNRQHVGMKPNGRDVAKIVFNAIESLWSKTTIPTLSQKSIIDKILNDHNVYQKFKDHYKTKTESDLAAFRQISMCLFDISKCKCEFDCSCPIALKIKTEIDKIFLRDQRTLREYYISGKDRILTDLARRHEERVERDQKLSQIKFEKAKAESIEANTVRGDELLEALADCCGSDGDLSDHLIDEAVGGNYVLRKKSQSNQMRTPLPMTALASDAFAISPKACSVVLTCGFYDVGYISKDNNKNIVDCSKIRRERKSMRKQLKDEHSAKYRSIKTLTFDERKDLTMTQIRSHQIVKLLEAHVVMLTNCKYLAHVTVPSGPSKAQVKLFKQFKKTPIFKKYQKDQNQLNKRNKVDDSIATKKPSVFKLAKNCLNDFVAKSKGNKRTLDGPDSNEKLNTENFLGDKSLEEWLELLNDDSFKDLTEEEIQSGAMRLVSAMLDYLDKENISYKDLEHVGCDGCPTNTGKHNGAIRLLEKILGFALQWGVCLIHGNELPFRHLFEHLDGATSGPNSFKGPIGQMLASAESLTVANGYQPIVVDYFPILNDISELSKDQQQLYRLCRAISEGSTTDSVFSEQYGPAVLSRWLTTCIRVLKLYVHYLNPPKALTILAKFIMFVYAPCWFEIRLEPSLSEGPRHFFRLVERSRDLLEDSPKLLKIVQDSLQRNAFFCHPENILIAMLTDSDHLVKDKAFELIKIARSIEHSSPEPRKFEIPFVNFQANNYQELIDWDACDITEPPILRNVEDCDLLDYEVPEDYLCHNQPVERHICLVTEASSQVCGPDARHGFILAKLRFREIFNKCNTKKDFLTMFD